MRHAICRPVWSAQQGTCHEASFRRIATEHVSEQGANAMSERTDSRAMRRHFLSGLCVGLRVVWPILSGLLSMIVALGLVIGRIEGWTLTDSIYFAFVTGLTIGYGDFSPKTVVTR